MSRIVTKRIPFPVKSLLESLPMNFNFYLASLALNTKKWLQLLANQLLKSEDPVVAEVTGLCDVKVLRLMP